MPQPASKPYTPPTWAFPPAPDAGTVRQLASLDRAARAADRLPPRRETPICFLPLVEPDEPRDRAGNLLTIAVAVIGAWIVVALVVAAIVGTGE